MYPSFDTRQLKIAPISERRNDLDMSAILPLVRPSEPLNESLALVAERIIEARKCGASVIMMMGAHVIRSGVQRYIIDLMERNLITCIAMNGACIIHDFEFSLIGKTTENVSKYIKSGRFGLWRETGMINDIVGKADREGLGLGEAVGKTIFEEDFPHKDISLPATGYRLKIPITVHVGIGYDIVFEHPNCDGGAYGATSYRDFLRFVSAVSSLEGGVIMNFGSAVMGPEVFLKALAMARNAAFQQKKNIADFTALVCDIRKLPEDFHGEATKMSEGYYFRPWKTMLVRTVEDKGESYYVQARHADSLPELWHQIVRRVPTTSKGMA